VAADFVLRADIHAADAILDVADCQDVDLIVIATHGRSRLRRLFIGSVADKVLRAAHVPVLLVRPAEIAHAADSRAAALSAQSSDA
jgi:nucleotide-binding universal stress UspA family protein